MGFRIRVMPGISVGISKRGLRTSIGPRIARVHFGAGPVGLSTGLGPVSASMSLAGSGTLKRRSYSNSYGLEALRVSHAAEAEFIQKRTRELTDAHRVALPPLAKPQFTTRAIPSVEELAAKYYARYSSGLGALQIGAKAAARDKAYSEARQEHQRLEKAANSDSKDAQAYLNRHWDLVQKNDPEAVIRAISDVFGESEAIAAPLGVEGDTVSVVMLAPEISLVPTRISDLDDQGLLFVRDSSPSELRRFYLDMVASQCVATIREAFWAAPSIQKVNIVMVRQAGTSSSTGDSFSCLGYGIAVRNRMRSAMLEKGPWPVLLKLAQPWTYELSQQLELQPLNLEDELELNELISGFRLD